MSTEPAAAITDRIEDATAAHGWTVKDLQTYAAPSGRRITVSVSCRQGAGFAAFAQEAFQAPAGWKVRGRGTVPRERGGKWWAAYHLVFQQQP